MRIYQALILVGFWKLAHDLFIKFVLMFLKPKPQRNASALRGERYLI